MVVDPQRDITGYLDDADAHGLTIERVIETHFHADFLSGHLELAEATGAAISYGNAATAEFPIDPLAHGQRLELGDVVLEVRHTPGHTPESISLVVWEHADDAVPWGVLTGDTLFVGDVGRPDLLTSVGHSAEGLARQLYRSLHEQLLTLPDETRVFPAHGAGSACGKAMSDAVSSTIGEQRRWNYALRPMSEDAFVDVVTEGQSVAPLYFAFTADTQPAASTTCSTTPSRRSPRRRRARALPARGRRRASTAARPRRSPPGTCAARSTSGLDGRFAEYAGDVVRARPAGRGGHRRGARGRGQGAPGPHRLRPGPWRGRRRRAAAGRAPRAGARATRLAARDLASWRDEEPRPAGRRRPQPRRAGGRRRPRRGAHPPRPAARPPPASSTPRRRPSSTAPAATGPRSRRRCSARSASTQVADLQGGYDAWAAAGLPTTSAQPLAG